MASLEEIERQIRELQQEVGGEDDFGESDDDHDGELEHDEEDGGRHEHINSSQQDRNVIISEKVRSGKRVNHDDDNQDRRKARKQSIVDDADSSPEDDDHEELAPIPPLPKELVPAPGLLLSAAARKREADRVQQGRVPSKSKKIECKPCSEVYFSEEAYKKHSRTLKHRQNIILKAGAAYEAANHEANFCRACNAKFETVEQLLAHRGTSEHKAAVQKLAKSSYCFVCKKQFTSPLQLREHVQGKQHNDAVESKTGYRPYKGGKPKQH